MPQVVVDANIVVKLLVSTEQSAPLDAMVAEWDAEGVQVLAPPHMISEVTNVLRRKVVRREISTDEGDSAFEALMLFPLAEQPTTDHLPLAWDLAKQFGLTNTYDAEYMALAYSLGCDFWTADARFVRSLGAAAPGWVRAAPAEAS